MDERAALRWLRARFREVGTPERAASERAYLKSDLRFYGATQPEVRRAAADLLREHPDVDAGDLRRIAEAAYATDEHELRSASIGVLERRSRLLGEDDLGWLIELVRRSNTWAHVDWLAIKVIGDVIARAKRPARWLEPWARDERFWVRRTAILAQHDELKAGRGDFPLFARLAAGMLEEREFFIRKAIGWVLREVSKRDPDRAFGFLSEHRGRVARLTLQEGAKYLSPAQREALGLAGKSQRSASARRSAQALS